MKAFTPTIKEIQKRREALFQVYLKEGFSRMTARRNADKFYEHLLKGGTKN